MRMFGAKAYVHMLQQLRCKLDLLSQPGTFIRCESDSKAYRVLTSSGKVEVSRNVIFDESLPTAADREAAPEADMITTKVSENVCHNMPLSTPTTGDAASSDAVSLDTDPGPTYLTV